jgi:hypothetical protein
MGYRFKLKKQAREKLLREKRKAELLGSQDNLFAGAPTEYTVTFTCHLRKHSIASLIRGLNGMLIADAGRILFWSQHGTLGHLSEEDTPEVLAILEQLPGDVPACLAEVVSDPDDFNTCQLQLRHGN